MSKRVLLDSPLKNRFIGTILAGKSVSKAAEIYGIKSHIDALALVAPIGYPLVLNVELIDPPISADSVRRIMARAGYHRRKARTVFYLTATHRARRLKWAHEHADWTDFEWSRVIWSDEAYVVVGDRAGQVYVTRRADEVYNDDCVVEKFKQSSFRIMIWGCIMMGRKGPLTVLEYPGGKGGGMNAHRYREQVLESHLLEFYQEMSEERGLVAFQQDGAGSHTAGMTKKWLKDHLVDIFPHPAASPDMSPIEPIWHVLKEKIRMRPQAPTSQEELKQAVREAWDEISEEDINKHVQSMQNRIQDLIKAKGGHTRY
ncbi:hypothetical protein HWV62_8469 [Athelia sp. TMB]|nr:hypothetical protein HWV62_8469 [Athelia sp. TMB]